MDRVPTPDPDPLLDALEREGQLLRTAAIGRLDAPVPACPGWVVADVLGHLGRVYRSVADIVGARLLEAPTARVPRPPEGAAVQEFFLEGLDELLRVLRATPAATPVHTWSDDRTAGFYRRRLCHETAAHRLDVDPVTPLDAEVAADGIAELYEVVMPFGLARHAGPRPAGTLHLHRTDGVGEWTLELVGDELRVGHGHTKADAAVRGPAGELFVFAWHRGRGPALEFFGDDAVADAWAALAP